MKILKYILTRIAMAALSLSLFQCGAAKPLDSNNSLVIQEVYYSQLDSINWEIVVVVKSQNESLDHVYFHGRKINLEQTDDNLYSGSYQKRQLKKNDVIMSDKAFAEYGNTVPKLPEKIPFNLKENECMVGYKMGSEVQYFKYSKVIRK